MSFINEDFMLSGQTAGELYHEAAEGMPIIDYHCHLIPQMIAENHQFRDITELWLGGDCALHDAQSALPLDSP